MINLGKFGFSNHLYLCEDGNIYDNMNDQIIEANSKHIFNIEGNDGRKQKVSLRPLYYRVYGKRYCKDNIINIDNEQWKAINGTDQRYWISSKDMKLSY